MNRTPDLIDVARGQWRAVHPEADTSSIEVIGRVFRAAAMLRRRLDTVLAEEGLNRAEFDLLCALRRSERPMTVGSLNDHTVSSGAATTKRLRQLSERGLLERITDERDRRVARIRLTELGHEVIDRAFHRNLAAERRLLAPLAAQQRETLADSLAVLLNLLEAPATPRTEP
jgi:DNA-binding MarR family transcriptional regulator